MQFFKALSLFTVFFAGLVGLAGANPVAGLKRDLVEARAGKTIDVGPQVLSALRGLQLNLTAVLAQINVDAVLNAGLNVTAEVQPLWLEVIADVEVAVDLLTAIDATALLSISAAEKAQIELLIAQIYAAITLSVDVWVDAQVKALALVIVQLDVTLKALLDISAKLGIALSVVASLLVNLKVQLEANLSLVAQVLLL